MLFFVIIIILLYVSTKRELNKGSENGKTSFKKNLAQIPYKQLSGWTVQAKLKFPKFLLYSVVMKSRKQGNKEK